MDVYSCVLPSVQMNHATIASQTEQANILVVVSHMSLLKPALSLVALRLHLSTKDTAERLLCQFLFWKYLAPFFSCAHRVPILLG